MLGILIRVSLEQLSVLISNCRGSCQHLFEISRYKIQCRAPVYLNKLSCCPLGSHGIGPQSLTPLSARAAQILRDSAALTPEILAGPCPLVCQAPGTLEIGL